MILIAAVLLLAHRAEATRMSLESRERSTVGKSDQRGAPFSVLGRSIIRKLEEAWPHDEIHEGAEQWGVDTDTVLEKDWLLVSPMNQVGHSTSELVVAVECEPSNGGGHNRINCDSDFRMYTCTEQADCEFDGGTLGRCTQLRSTVSRVGQAPRSLCAGHSDALYDRMYQVMVEANEFIDIATLTAPTDRFLSAFRNAITYLHSTGKFVQVRFIMSTLAGSATQVSADLLRDVPKFLGESNLMLSVGFYRAGIGWWNHAKIIAVDGKKLIQGGHNLMGEHYLKYSPVHDVSMQIAGTATKRAHTFLNRIWRSVCKFRMGVFWRLRGYKAVVNFPKDIKKWTKVTSFQSKVKEVLDLRDRCPPEYIGTVPDDETGIGVPTISIGRQGGMSVGLHSFGHIDMKGGPADDALYTMLGGAEKSIKLSLQDLGGMMGGKLGVTSMAWSTKVMKNLCKALENGVHIYLVLSSPKSLPDGVSPADANYGNGWALPRVAGKFVVFLARYNQRNTTKGDIARVCKQVHITQIRYHKEEELFHPSAVRKGFDGGHTRISNHAKLYFVDDSLFYMGSENLYPASLAEYGLIIDDAKVTADFLKTYWDPLWEASKAGQPWGPDSGGKECTVTGREGKWLR